MLGVLTTKDTKGHKGKILKKTPETKSNKISTEMALEYHFDYHAAHANRFSNQMDDSPLIVILDEDVVKVFTTEDLLN